MDRESGQQIANCGWSRKRYATESRRQPLYSLGKMLDLNTLLPQGSGWKSLTPRCINDRGQIAGIGIATDGKPHIFLMTPAPSPRGSYLYRDIRGGVQTAVAPSLEGRSSDVSQSAGPIAAQRLSPSRTDPAGSRALRSHHSRCRRWTRESSTRSGVQDQPPEGAELKTAHRRNERGWTPQ